MVVAVAGPLSEGATAPPKRSRRLSLRGIRWWRGVVLVLTGIFFLLPLYAALRFALEDNLGHLTTAAFTAIVHETGFLGAL
jgi:ABC-type sulfate transport system permease component